MSATVSIYCLLAPYQNSYKTYQKSNVFSQNETNQSGKCRRDVSILDHHPRVTHRTAAVLHQQPQRRKDLARSALSTHEF